MDRICQSLGHPRRPRLVVIDGAQALCHTGCRPGIEYADVYLAGCHKWLRAGSLPLGVAFCPRTRSCEAIQTTAAQMLEATELDDPLLRFIQEMESSRLSRFSETVSLAPVFACQGAVFQQRYEKTSLPAAFACQLRNADRVAEAGNAVGWQPLRPTESFRSGILLLRARAPAVRAVAPETLRQRFQQQGLALTAYDGGVIRLSMPPLPLERFEMVDLLSALRHCAVDQAANERRFAPAVRKCAG